MVAVACGVSGVQVGCKGVVVPVGTVGRSATLATVGSMVGEASASAIWVLTLLLSWLKLARCRGETMSSTTMITASAAKMSNAAVSTFRQLPRQPLLEFFFWLNIVFLCCILVGFDEEFNGGLVPQVTQPGLEGLLQQTIA